MTELCKLAAKYRSDKVPHLGHNYTPLYNVLLKHKRDSIKKVLEIGIGFQGTMPHVKDYLTGASLFMWRDYFPNAQIFGADIKHDVLISGERIQSIKCDQSNELDLLKLASHFSNDIDLIIDDGSHIEEHQLLSALVLMPHLSQDGLYIIEDVCDPQKILPGLKDYDAFAVLPDDGQTRLRGQDDLRNKLIIISKC